MELVVLVSKENRYVTTVIDSINTVKKMLFVGGLIFVVLCVDQITKFGIQEVRDSS